MLYADGRTEGLASLYSQLSKTNPSDIISKNNLAMVALLLKSPQQYNAHELAREVYDKSPTNATFASTYAFSLYRGSDFKKAQQVLEQLSPKDLEKPSIAAYYGVVLKAAGDTAKAKKYLDLALTSTNVTFLPEERKLIEEARRM
jgi:Flp pilus assembly protein TadD